MAHRTGLGADRRRHRSGILAVSSLWPTADGVITRIDIARKSSGGSPSGHYFSATFTYNFCDPSGAASPAIGAKIFQTRRKREPLQIANWPSTRKVSLDSIQEVPFKTISNSIRGLICVTGQPALTFNVADAAACTLLVKSSTAHKTRSASLRRIRRSP